MSAVEQIIWAAWCDFRNTSEMVDILNRVPQIRGDCLDDGDDWTEAKVSKILWRLKDMHYRGELVRVAA